jgi:hypothetical protein
MVEKLCTPSDDEHNEHKRLQLRELAALNGTLKDITACFVCGDEGHDAEHCPKKVCFAAVHLCSVLGILGIIVEGSIACLTSLSVAGPPCNQLSFSGPYLLQPSAEICLSAIDGVRCCTSH